MIAQTMGNGQEAQRKKHHPQSGICPPPAPYTWDKKHGFNQSQG